MPLEIRDGYKGWIADPVRTKSPELDFGCWWKLHPDNQPLQAIVLMTGEQSLSVVSASINSRWRVSWIDDTGELYAKEQPMESNRYILIGSFPTEKAIEARMDGWAEGGAKALTDFFAREFAQEITQ